MKAKQKKQFQYQLARENLSYYLDLIRYRHYPNYTSYYIGEVKKFATAFRIRLSREEKLLFCKYCNSPLYSSTKSIRLNKKTKTKDIICKNCGIIRRFPYK